MQPKKIFFLLDVKWKLYELRGRQVVPVIPHTFDSVPYLYGGGERLFTGYINPCLYSVETEPKNEILCQD